MFKFPCYVCWDEYQLNVHTMRHYIMQPARTEIIINKIYVTKQSFTF